MMQRIRKLQQNEGGFTLIELLIVIIILGILAAVVVFAVGGITNRGTQAACKSDYKQVEIAQEAFFAQSTPPAYAANVGALVPTYLKEPPSSNAYAIVTDNTGKVYAGATPGTATTPTNAFCLTL